MKRDITAEAYTRALTLKRLKTFVETFLASVFFVYLYCLLYFVRHFLPRSFLFCKWIVITLHKTFLCVNLSLILPIPMMSDQLIDIDLKHLIQSNIILNIQSHMFTHHTSSTVLRCTLLVGNIETSGM